MLGQARGVALAAVGGAGLPFEELAAAGIKLAVTGSGAAEKPQVQAMVRACSRCGRCPARDAADALAAAICHGQMHGAIARGARANAAASALPISEARKLWEESAARPRRRARATQFVLRTPR